jgi:hypothetical protein
MYCRSEAGHVRRRSLLALALPVPGQQMVNALGRVICRTAAAQNMHALPHPRSPLLIRFFVHRHTNDSFQFAVSFYHAILDGWCVAVF